MTAKHRNRSRNARVLEKARLYTGDFDEEIEIHISPIGQVAIAIIASVEKPGPNEDSAALIPVGEDCLVLAVADGVGGAPTARKASNLTLETLEHCLSKADSNRGDVRAAILDGIEQANSALLALGTGTATTIAVAEIRPGAIRCYHVGDSGIWLFGQRGLMKMQTTPHSPIGFAVEAGLLNEKEALQHQHLHLISNVVGSPDMSIEIGSELPMNPYDTVLLASDGLFDNLMQKEIVRIVRAGPIGDAVNQVTDLAQKRMRELTPGKPGKPDDYTAVLFRPNPKTWKKPSA